MLKLIPVKYKAELLSAIAKGNFEDIKRIIDGCRIDPNDYDDYSYTPILMHVLTSYGITDENERLTILRYFLEKGADPNLNCKAGYNVLHVAVQQDTLIKALDLFLDFGGDVNSIDQNGATVTFWAIQSFPWRSVGEHRQNHLHVLEKMFMLGANLDFANKFGVTPRKWLERTSDDVQQLAEKCEQLNPVYKPIHRIQPEFPSNYKFPDTVKRIRENLIPLRGKAETTEGEMLRLLDILQDEAYRNGNANFSKSYKAFAQYISDKLANSGFFTKSEIDNIVHSAKKLMHAKHPYLEGDDHDNFTDQFLFAL